jgi:hypothetical protein
MGYISDRLDRIKIPAVQLSREPMVVRAIILAASDAFPPMALAIT